MKVAHLLRKYHPEEWGGTESYLKSLLKYLETHHCHSVIFCPSLPSYPKSDPLAEDGHEIHRFQAHVPIWGLSSEMKNEVISLGGNLLSFDLPWMLWKEPNVDIIHTHVLGRLGGVGRTIAKIKNIPFIVSVHGGVYDLPKKVKEGLQEIPKKGWDWGKVFGFFVGSHAVLDDADVIITLNAREASLVRKNHPQKEVLVIPSGIETKNFKINHKDLFFEKFPVLKNKKILLMVGRIDSTKNQLWVIQQTSKIIKKYPDVMIVLAGSCVNSDYEKKIKDYIKKNNLENYIFFTGGFSPQDPLLIGLYQSSQALILPSISETFGIVILEGWAANTCVISSKTSGAIDKIKHEENGWLFDLDQPEIFFQGLEVALNQPVVANNIRQSGFKLVCSHYDLNYTGNILNTLYLSLCAKKNHKMKS